MLLSIVFSFRNEEKVLVELIQRVKTVLDPLDIQYKLVFVNDDSTDHSLEILKEQVNENPRIVIINMSRRFGVTPCVLAGLKYAKNSDAIVYMDADLQDPPEIIPQMLESLKNGNEVVHTRRRSRKGEGKFKLWATSKAYWLLGLLSGGALLENCGDFKLISKRALGELLKLNETDPYMRGLVCWIGFKQDIIVYDRDERYSGDSHFSLWGSGPIKEFIRGLASFSAMPLYFSLFLGFFASFIAFTALIIILAQKMLGMNLPGWTAIMTSNLFLGGSIHLAVGFLGIYIARVYNELKKRPLFIVKDIIDLGPESEK